MILIRGIKGESYARKIEKGIVDCRDVLSSLLHPPVTGYDYSNYYEKNLVRALAYISNKKYENLHEPRFLYSLLIDYYIPHIYLTYFHILNEHSLEWLDKFDDDYQFIALNVKIDKITQTTIGNGFFGAKMSYVDSICELSQDSSTNSFYSACMCSIENLFSNKKHMIPSLQIYNTLSFALLCREQNEKFTDIENEFRIIAYDCPKIENGIMKQIPREVTISGKSGIKYKGVLTAGENSVFKSDCYILKNPNKLLKNIVVDEQGMITLDSLFKPINISDISDDYKYLGTKSNCANYIKKMIKYEHKNIYINRTIHKTYNTNDIPNAAFVPGYIKVKF